MLGGQEREGKKMGKEKEGRKRVRMMCLLEKRERGRKKTRLGVKAKGTKLENRWKERMKILSQGGKKKKMRMMMRKSNKRKSKSDSKKKGRRKRREKEEMETLNKIMKEIAQGEVVTKEEWGKGIAKAAALETNAERTAGRTVRAERRNRGEMEREEKGKQVKKWKRRKRRRKGYWKS
jgi:hypothetical protein